MTSRWRPGGISLYGTLPGQLALRTCHILALVLRLLRPVIIPFSLLKLNSVHFFSPHQARWRVRCMLLRAKCTSKRTTTRALICKAGSAIVCQRTLHTAPSHFAIRRCVTYSLAPEALNNFTAGSERNDFDLESVTFSNFQDLMQASFGLQFDFE